MAAHSEAAPLVLAGGRFPTLDDPHDPFLTDTLVVSEGRIVALGAWSELRDALPVGAEVRDLAGATVLPGLGDAHVHLTATGFLETAVRGDDAGDVATLLRHVRIRAQELAPGTVVLGLRVDPDALAEERAPTRDELDAAVPGRPVYLRHVTGHASYANSAALAELELGPGAPGVELDEVGRPTGVLVGHATQYATQRMYASYSRQIGYAGAFHAACARAVRHGCTAVHALDDLEAVRSLLAVEHELPLRVTAYPQSFDLDAVQALGLSRLGGCHGCALDGDVDVGTAALLEPYPELPGAYGTLYHNDMSLQGFVLAAHRAGAQLAFHAVGDRAVEQALQAFERAQEAEARPDARHRIEHAQLITPEQRTRARRAGVVLSVQPAFNHVWRHDGYVEVLGEARAQRIDPLGSLVRAGLPLAGGSDSTVTELRPLLGVHAAVNHSRPEERLDPGQALGLFTLGVAYAAHHERSRGRVAVGYDADLTVVDRDPFQVEPRALAELRPLLTVVGGHVVHAA